MNLLLASILIPVLAAILVIAGFNARRTAIFAAALNFLLTLVIVGQFKQDGGYQFLLSVPAVPPLASSSRSASTASASPCSSSRRR